MSQPAGQTKEDMDTLEEAAAWLHISPRKLSAWARAGRVPAVIISRKVIRFHRPTILEHFRKKALP